MNHALKAWKTILAVKERAHKRAEEALTAQRKILAGCQAKVAEAQQQQNVALNRREAAREAQRAMLAQPQGFSPELYLRHQTHLNDLDATLVHAEAEVKRTQANVESQRKQVDIARREVSRVEASMDACKGLRDKLVQALAVAEEMAQDEEAGEVAAARIFSKRKAAMAEGA